MTKIKKLFTSSHKIIVSSVCIVAALTLLSTGTALAISTIAENSSIGAENAKNFACEDAGLDPVSVEMVRTEFEYEQGQFVYQVEFIADGTEYEYWIKAADGTVVKKNLEIVRKAENTQLLTTVTPVSQATTAPQPTDALEVVPSIEVDSASQVEVPSVSQVKEEIPSIAARVVTDEQQAVPTPEATILQESTPQPNKTKIDAQNQITVETAKATALEDAMLSASDATFTKEKLDRDDGIVEYDIEFYTAAYEYEYEINASTGGINSKSMKTYSPKKSASKDNIIEDSVAYIGIDAAKAIVANHAGLLIDEVTLSKAKLDKEDGQIVYDVEFYKDGIEYEYEIDAVSGAILEYDSERD